MIQILRNYLSQLSDTAGRYALLNILVPIVTRFRSCTLSTAGLVITATAGKKVPKTGAAVTHFIADGVKGRITAGTDMPALIGTVTADMFNVFVFCVDKAGTLTTLMGTEGATEADIKWPKLDPKKAILGFIVINPTGTGNFVGNTDALDDVTIAPNTVYISPVGTFDPQVLTGVASL